MKTNSLLTLLLAGTTALLPVSCTYDYFEDETDYQVFVPEVQDRSVGDCRVLVYDAGGTLVGMRHAVSPYTGDPRTGAGLFSFRLPPGEYRVYCYANTDSFRFEGRERLDTSAFLLNRHPAAQDAYAAPSDLLFQSFLPSIAAPGLLQTDTARLERYTGRVTVRFRHFPGDVSRVREVRLQAEGVPVMQLLKRDTLASRLTPDDKILHSGSLPVLSSAGLLETDHRFLPSIDGETMRLVYTFLDGGGNAVATLPVEVRERDTGMPLRLLHGRRIIIEVDSYTVVGLSVTGWEEDIADGDTDMQ